MRLILIIKASCTLAWMKAFLTIQQKLSKIGTETKGNWLPGQTWAFSICLRSVPGDRKKESNAYACEGEGVFQYGWQNPDHQICIFLVQIGPVNFPTSTDGFLNESSDGKCMRNLNREEIYLRDLPLRDDEECNFLDQISIPSKILMEFNFYQWP